jgi:hypothetical protein
MPIQSEKILLVSIHPFRLAISNKDNAIRAF